MLIVESPDRRYKIVSLGKDGWFFYRPPVQSEGEGIFISIDDPLVTSLAEELRMDRKKLTGSRRAAEILLIRLISKVEGIRKKSEAYALA
jgi:hypothetical protein